MRSCLSILVLGAVLAVVLSGCVSRPPLPTADRVDLGRFMGAWYVVGYTPIIFDTDAYNAVEHYARAPDGRILTTYQFRKGSFDGPLKTFTPTGFVDDSETDAEWGMQFLWPFKANYTILYVSDDYQQTIIAHPNRKYAWIMTRSPQPGDAVYQALLDRLSDAGFDPSVMQRVPQDWSNETERLDALAAAGADRPLVPR